jgi:hypothetical protein
MRSFSILPLVLFLVAGCAVGNMHPGDSCARCHNGESGWGNSSRFGAAGTVYTRAGKGDANVNVDITDARGRSVSLTSNAAGNFFTGQSLAPPLKVKLFRAGRPSVSATVPSGDCNACHSKGSSLGRICAP